MKEVETFLQDKTILSQKRMTLKRCMCLHHVTANMNELSIEGIVWMKMT